MMIGEITSPAEYSPLNILEQASNSNEKVTNSSANTTLPESMVSMGQKNAYPVNHVNHAEPILSFYI
ncbi:unnamed protein product [Cuscuta campestris]|uniref:Uncharacterized protein n=1 Tax=Cuscuta campestris TaxID=132261 RepID=A0A484K522_9ASTE|nr:unnamed protein product [Cuscuta campestris]